MVAINVSSTCLNRFRLRGSTYASATRVCDARSNRRVGTKTKVSMFRLTFISPKIRARFCSIPAAPTRMARMVALTFVRVSVRMSRSSRALSLSVTVSARCEPIHPTRDRLETSKTGRRSSCRWCRFQGVPTWSVSGIGNRSRAKPSGWSGSAIGTTTYIVLCELEPGMRGYKQYLDIRRFSRDPEF